MGVTVDGVEIPESEIQAEMARLRQGYDEYVKREGGEPNEVQLREWAAEGLVEGALLKKEAAATQPVPSDERIRKELETNASAYAGFPEEARPDLARTALQKRRLTREIKKGVPQPSEAEVRAYYDANGDQFEMPESLTLSHICRFVDFTSRADVFLELLRVKTDVEQGRLTWREAVEAYSDTAEKDGGLFGTLPRWEMPGDIEKKLFALNPGEMSDVIETDGQTLQIFRVLARVAPKKLSYGEIKDHLKNMMFEQACGDALNARIDALKAAAVIEGLSSPES